MTGTKGDSQYDVTLMWLTDKTRLLFERDPHGIDVVKMTARRHNDVKTKTSTTLKPLDPFGTEKKEKITDLQITYMVYRR